VENCNPNWVPAARDALAIDPDGEPMEEKWSYPSVIGMLLYLTTNTRADLLFAVSQAARFTHNPKKSHATAVKTIVRYLKRTEDKGMILKPTGKLELDDYVDGSFGGQYKRDPDEDSSSAKSWISYYIFLGGCPLVFKSQLLSSICLSTQEVEYAGLSHSLRAVIPIRRILIETCTVLKIDKDLKASIHCRVFEDNNGALLLAKDHKITSRTKYYHLSYHHFWAYVKSKDVSIHSIDTTLQIGDLGTKGLPRETFEHLRKMLLGW